MTEGGTDRFIAKTELKQVLSAWGRAYALVAPGKVTNAYESVRFVAGPPLSIPQLLT
jgi:hypothetical protein